MKSLAVFLLLALAACSAAPLPSGVRDASPEELVAAAPVAYVLGPNDLVRVIVFGHQALSTHDLGERIDPQGRINLPLLGPVPIAGLEPDAAREVIRERLLEFLVDPRVTLSVIEYSSNRFYVFGEVQRPGAYPLDRPLTALQALTAAGAFLPGADRETVALLRGGRDDLQVHFFDAATPGVDGLFPIHADDFLFVRQSAAGTFRDQILPVVQSVVPPLTALASLIIAADALED